MKVGVNFLFQSAGAAISDQDVYRRDMRLAELAVKLGFDALSTVEHHATDYAITPDVLQILTYWAGRFPSVELMSQVVILPWHNPLRVAEQVALLDTLCEGRFTLGIGRGLGRREFEAFNLDMNHSREIFVESARTLLTGLENGFCDYDGVHIKQKRAEIRPRPHRSFKGRSYAAIGSPESARIMAELGIGVLIVPQKPWDALAKELANFRALYREFNAAPAPAPCVSAMVYCRDQEGAARAGAREWIGRYWDTVVAQYEFKGDHFQKLKGYEAYRSMQDATSAEGGADRMTDFFVSLHCGGTPDQCFDQIMAYRQHTGCEAFFPNFSFAGLPFEEAERSMRLFADEVLPRLKSLPAPQAEAA